MSRFVFLLAGIFLCLCTEAQIPVINSNPRIITELIPLKNGRYNHVTAISNDREGKFVINKPEKSPETENRELNKPKNAPLQTFHIVFHFDINPFIGVICNGVDTVYSSGYNMIWINDTLLEADMEEGYYDLLCSFLQASVQKHVFTKNFHVYQDTDTTILSSSAIHTITLNAYDENNVILNPSNLPGSDMGLLFEFPGVYKMQIRTILAGRFGVNTIHFSDIPSDIKISPGRTEVKKDIITVDELYHRYVISYPVLSGISDDTLLANTPSDYRQFYAVFHASPAFQEGYYGFSYGYMTNQLLLDLRYFEMGFSNGEYPCAAIDTCRIFASNVVIDTNKGFFTSGVIHWEDNPVNPVSPSASIWSSLNYISPYNNLVLSSEGNYPPVPGDYQMPPGSFIHFGDVSPHRENVGFNSQQNGLIFIYSYSWGQANEDRLIDNVEGTYEIWQGNQQLTTGSLEMGAIYYSVIDPGEYTVIMHDSNYRLLDKQGSLQSILTFDLSKPDPNSPTLTAMRIVKDGFISPELIHGYEATIEFTAGDFNYSPTTYLGLSEVQFFYKESSNTLWTQLPVTAQPGLLDSIAGMPYVVDLAPVMNQFSDSAWIDIRIVLTDLVGNTNVQTIQPAFLIRDQLVGTDPENEFTPFRIYPNPAETSILVELPSGIHQPIITLYDLKGIPYSTIHIPPDQSQAMIDVSTLKPGFYLLKVIERDKVLGVEKIVVN
ncbi:MAG: T9SS type A sorting domain-containing protein [Bacteroidota bacterium]